MNPSETSIEAEVSMEMEATEVPEDPPFHLLVIGDFSGSTGSRKSLQTYEIDRDDYSDVLSRMAPSVQIGGGPREGVEISFRSLDDFHPDHLFGSLAIFDELREIRSRLLDEDSFAGAAREVRGWFSDEPEEAVQTAEPPSVLGGEGLVDDILSGRTRDAAAYKMQKMTALKQFVKKVVDPHLVKIDETEQSKLVSAVDEAVSGVMRKILRDNGFRALEAAWRGLHLMCRRVETSTHLKIFVADISKERVLEELKDVSSEINRLLISGSEANGNEPWAAIIGVFDFDLTVDDIAGLIRVGGVTGAASTPFVSHIRPGMLGIRAFAGQPDHTGWDTKSDTAERKLWNALRASADSASIGLVAPRLLARLPYGEATDSTEVFEFEEFEGQPDHDDYLWMNPGFGFGVVIAETFARYGWEFGGRYELDLNGLPVHVFSGETGAGTKPCAEIEMTDVALEILLEQGLMPFASFKNSDRVRLGGIQSVSSTGASLKGRWS